MGPTASGKTHLAESLADRLDALLINADAFQVYRDMDIGTAKPDAKERYRLIDFKNPDEGFGVGEWVRLALNCLSEAWSEKRSVVVVGGTGFYIRALFESYGEMKPPASADWAPLNTITHCAPCDRQRRSAVPSCSRPEAIAQTPKTPSTACMPELNASATASVVRPLAHTLMRCVRLARMPPLAFASTPLAAASQAGYRTSSSAAATGERVPISSAAATQSAENSARAR